MVTIVITFSNNYAFTFKGNLSEFSKDVINCFKELDGNANESNTCVKYCSNFIENPSIKVLIKLSGVPKGFLKTKLDEKINFINNLCRILDYYKIKLDSNNIALEQEAGNTDSDFDIDKKAGQFTPVAPNYTFDRVIIADEIKDEIRKAISLVDCRKTVFEEWGLYEIEPNPSTSLNFYGPSGTGKTMCAEAVAHELGKKILRVSYSDVESKYHGEGPKMVRAIFYAAEKEDAVLFFDEADSLLSKRLTNVSDGSAQAINSMRSQLLISLENFKGIVIFATNLKENYDPAFCTRLHSIEFKEPDENIREQIWNVHLHHKDDEKEQIVNNSLNDSEENQATVSLTNETETKQRAILNLPLDSDVDKNIKDLAKMFDFVGRDIRNSVIRACVNVAFENKDKNPKDIVITLDDIKKACEIINEEKLKEKKAQNYRLTPEQVQQITQEAGQRVQAAEQKATEAEQKLQEAEIEIIEAEQKVQEAEERAKKADQRAYEAEAKAKEADRRAQAAKIGIKEAEQKAQEAIERVLKSENISDNTAQDKDNKDSKKTKPKMSIKFWNHTKKEKSDNKL